MSRFFNVSFYPRKDRAKEDGMVPIAIRISLRGNRLNIGNTGVHVKIEHWIPSKNRVKLTSKNASAINNELDRIETDLEFIYRQLEFSKELSVEAIKDRYLGKNDSHDSFLEFYDEYLKRVNSEVGVSRSGASAQKYNVVRKHFEAFLKKKRKRKDIELKDLKFSIVNDFFLYLQTDAKMCHNTAMKAMQFLKTITLYAMKTGKISFDPFADFKIRFTQVDRGFLDDDELKRIMEYEFDIPRLELVRDIFIFACFTGLAYIDVAQLTVDNIIELNGQLWIMTRRQKTDVPSRIPLLDIPKQLIGKYKDSTEDDRLFPIYSNQKMNVYLKEIATLCKIKKNISFHLARHTFATMSLSKGVTVESVSKMLGHTNICTTQIYAKITNKKIEEEMKRLADSIGDFKMANEKNKTSASSDINELEELNSTVTPLPSRKKKNKKDKPGEN